MKRKYVTLCVPKVRASNVRRMTEKKHWDFWFVFPMLWITLWLTFSPLHELILKFIREKLAKKHSIEKKFNKKQNVSAQRTVRVFCFVFVLWFYNSSSFQRKFQSAMAAADEWTAVLDVLIDRCTIRLHGSGLFLEDWKILRLDAKILGVALNRAHTCENNAIHCSNHRTFIHSMYTQHQHWW